MKYSVWDELMAEADGVEKPKLKIRSDASISRSLTMTRLNKLPMSADKKAKISQGNMGRTDSAETRLKKSVAVRKALTPEVIEKRAANQRGKKKKPHTEEWKAKHSVRMSGMSWWNNGETSTRTEKSPGPEWKPGRLKTWVAKQSTTTCPHCSKVGSVVNMKRWHFDNCKKKP